MKQKPFIALAFVLSALFLFLRLFKLQDSLFFFNDAGRDFLVLQEWLLSGKPPLLGPQTSVLPINQSALYFYLLYPLFLISNQSPLSPIITACLVYLASFFYCLFISKNDPKLQRAVLISFFFITIHPQLIIQTRSVWNPTFVTPALLPALAHLILFFKSKQNSHLVLTSAFVAFALSMSYSSAILLPSILVILLGFYRKTIIKFLISLVIFLGIFNLPTIFFELRHGFLLTTSLFTKSSTPQEEIFFIQKLSALSNFVIGSSNQNLNLIIVIAAFFVFLFLSLKFKSANRILYFILILTMAFSLLSPFSVRPQYIFPITISLFLVIALLPLKSSLSILALSSLIYAKPSRLNPYFQPAPRTFSQMENCFKNICDEQKIPLFVSVQSSYHPYHNGPEHRYLLKKLGCNIKDIDTENGSTNLMAVVNDGGAYEHGITSYHELDLFGTSTLQKTYDCQDNFKVYLLAH